MAVFNLNKKTVIITGVSGGFGSEMAKILLKDYGCRVIGIGRSYEKLCALKEELKEYGNRLRCCAFDVSVRENWEKLAKTLEDKNIIPDLLINNAGIMPPFERFEKHGSDTAKKVMDVNYMSVVYGCEVMIPLLKKSKHGGILNVASSAAYSAVLGTAVYSASKGAVKNFTLALAEEYEGELYIGVACPGMSDTDLFRDTEMSDEERKIINEMGTKKEDMAKMILEGIREGKKLVLCGKDSKLMTALTAVAPSKANGLYSKVLRSAETKLFEGLSE